MEAVGTVAAVIQLVGLAKNIIEAISQLYDLIKDIPGRYRSWKTGLAALKEIISRVQSNSVLHTSHVGHVMECMTSKVESLILLCGQHNPRSHSRPIKRILAAFSAYRVEPRIVQGFASLEQDKTTLILAINVDFISNSTQTTRLETGDMSNESNEELATMPTVAVAEPNPKVSKTSLETLISNALKGNASCDVLAIMQRLQVYAADNPGTHTSYSAHSSAQPRSMASGNQYHRIVVNGDGHIIGTTRQVQGSVFDGVEVAGNSSMLGDHDAAVALAHVNNNARGGQNQHRSQPGASTAAAAAAPEEEAVSPNATAGMDGEGH